VRRRLTLVAAAVTALSTHAWVNSRLLRRPVLPAPEATAKVSVLLPVRDEEAHVIACLATVLAQRGVPDLEILVLDDESQDQTSALLETVVDPRVTVLSGCALPDGWLGKPWACQQLADAATGEVLVFLDADVRLASSGLAATVAMLDHLDLVSPYPRQEAGTLAERLVQPLLQWTWLTFLPLRLAETSSLPSLAAANGQLIAVRREAYNRAGGHRAVRGEVIEDVALLRAVKRSGGRGTVVDGTAVATCRMYDGGRAMADGYTKSLWSAFGSPTAAAAVMGTLVVLYVVPPVAALRGSRTGLFGYAAGVTGRVVSARRTGGRVWPDAFLHPLSILALAGLTARSVRGRRAGTLSWKGRRLP
jgi:Glycosyl transferase family 2